jgi:hypothetical protein
MLSGINERVLALANVVLGGKRKSPECDFHSTIATSVLAWREREERDFSNSRYV